jgi:hypothetical protein
MKSRLISLWVLIFSWGFFQGQGQSSFDEKNTTVSNVRLNITNLGTFGNAFRGYRSADGNPSCEYPAGSGIEHVFEGGLWVGAKNSAGQVLVSTSAYDAPQGYAPGQGGFEMTASPGSQLTERSSLFDNRFFDPAAVSHQDYLATFTDSNITIPGTSIPISGHDRPMNIVVDMETYNWNFTFTDFLVIVKFTVKNRSQVTYSDLHVGLWNNAVVRNVNITPAGAGGVAFFNKGGNGYMDSINLAYSYDAAGDLGFTESYIGQIFLGATDKNGFRHPALDSTFNSNTNTWDTANSFNVNYNAWVFNDFSADFAFPNTEDQRFRKMSEGLEDNPCWDDPNGGNCGGTTIQALLAAAGNRSDLISAGPINNFAPGDEVEFSFAYVMAKKNEDGNPNTDNSLTQRANLIANAGWAQQAFNGEDQNFNGILDAGEDNDGDGKLTRFILPSPPAIPRTTIVPGTNQIDIYWADNSRNSIDPISNVKDFEGYKVYLSKQGFDVTGVQDLAADFNLVAQYDVAGNGLFNETGFEPIALSQPVFFENDTTPYLYQYTIENIPNGWQYAVAVTAFDRGNPESNLESLESSFLANNYRAFAGTLANADIEANQPFAYPNPYYYGAAWEGRSNFQEESRKIIFANLPKRCVIRVYTVAGDFIDEIRHDEDYNGGDIRWFETFGAEDEAENRFSGGEHAWDLLSLNSQIISRGLYLFSVQDLDSGQRTTGKFIIIK